MVIESVSIVSDQQVNRYCWRRLLQFQNVDFTSAKIIALHGLSKKDFSNAKKQAEQVKYCLTQAKEYYDASSGVSLATRPVLLYYATMSFALAEILLKQNGGSRLSELRAKHNCHGLQLVVEALPDPKDSLNIAASKLIAKPQFGSAGQPKGTFEVWRRSAREFPLGGYYKETFFNAASEQFTTLFGPSDQAPLPISKNGLSLADCLVELPYMAHSLNEWGMSLQMVRASVTAEKALGEEFPKYTVVIHPSRQDLLDKFGGLCTMTASVVNDMDVRELPSGFILTWRSTPDVHFFFPHSICINSRDIFFSCSSIGLGEFGFIYASLHILGNFARYYPDLWMRHIEANSPLASVVDELCNYAIARLPLLSLSELARSYYVIEK